MSLPLFKGASHDLISSFLEKTHLSFQNYGTEMKIVDLGQECNTVITLLSGSAVAIHPLFAGNLLVSEVIQPGAIFGVHRLYGRDTAYNFEATALTPCGCMEFSKAQYFSLLQSSQIFLMNYLNLLSLRGQKGEMALQRNRRDSLTLFLSYLIDMTTDRSSTSICLESRDGSLAELFSTRISNSAEEISRLHECGIVRKVSDRRMEIPSRRLLLEAAGVARL